jgi:hypothetical protein
MNSNNFPLNSSIKASKSSKNAKSNVSSSNSEKSDAATNEPATLGEGDKAAMNLLLNFKDSLNAPMNRSNQWDPLVAQNMMDPSNLFKMNQFSSFPFQLNGINSMNPADLMTAMSNANSLANSMAASNNLSSNNNINNNANNNPSGLGSNFPATAMLTSAPSVSSATAILTYNILQHFEPRFYTVYQSYLAFFKDTFHQDINPMDHLFALCLDHMIPFCCWARRNASVTNFIKSALEDNADLRPEVRNGISAILIYSFSAAQAKARHDTDMFLSLQDTDRGLGIVNKTSLKIYNDPYQYYNFLKSCITGLIDAGKIPENERVNNQVSLTLFI